ncbi:MAG: hypothetical protein IKO27_04475 [Ruminococcus sp.]|nr:hypothetical protein [Ruminococcus sp.]
MSNKEIYSKTLTFSLRRLLMSLITLTLFVTLCWGGYTIMEKVNNKGLIGLGIGAALAIVAAIIISHFFAYALHSAQIAMITRAVTENELPDDVYHEGVRMVKERFTTVAAFYLVTGVIKGIFRQIGNLITSAGKSLGGNTGETIGSVISSIIQVLIAYLCDCCLGWVFYRKEISSARATCEGAVIFFKNGKTLLKNMGRIFGMGILSFLVIAGAFGGIAYLIFSRFDSAFTALANEIAEAGARAETTIPSFFLDSNNLALVAAGITGIIIWTFIHSTFVRPFVLTGVIRNYMEAGVKNIPSDSDFNILDSKSPKFAKLHREMA